MDLSLRKDLSYFGFLFLNGCRLGNFSIDWSSEYVENL